MGNLFDNLPTMSAVARAVISSPEIASADVLARVLDMLGAVREVRERDEAERAGEAATAAGREGQVMADEANRHWTAGELRAALADVPDDTLIVVNTPDPQYDDMVEEWAICSAGYGSVDWGDGYGLERDQAFELSCRLAGDFRVKPDRPRKENGNG